MRVSRTTALAPVEQHEDDEKQQRQALQQHARLHQLVRAARIAALRHVDDAEQERSEHRQHREQHENGEDILHQSYIAPRARGAQGAALTPCVLRQAQDEVFSLWPWSMPSSMFLILSVSKDASGALQHH